MSFHQPSSQRAPWCNRAHSGGLALLLAIASLAWGGDAPLHVNRLSGVLGAAPETALTFSALYEENRDLAIGDFITVDLLAHAVTRLWHDTLPVYEMEVVIPRLKAATAELLKALASEPDSPATAANRDFLQLVHALLAGKPDGLSERAATEYQLVQAAQGEASSPLFGYRMDYSQFLPRAAYAETQERQQFFRAYRYAATALFPLVPSAALELDAATGQRLLAQLAQLARLKNLHGMQPVAALQVLQTSVTHLLPGQVASVDLDFLNSVARQDDLLAWGRALLQKAQQEGRQPQVLHAIINASALEPGLTARDAVTGYRLAPLLEAPDSRVFQRLVYDATGAWQGKDPAPKPLGLGVIEGFGPAKVRPLVDEWVAALGVLPLQQQLSQQGETAFARYPAWPELQKIATTGQGLDAPRLKLFTAYLTGSDPDWPQRAETIKGLWAEFKHAELLYQAQSYTVTGKGLTAEPVDPAQRGAVIEPASQAIQALQAFSAELAKRAPEAMQPRWTALSQQLQRATKLAEAHGGKPLPLADQTFLRALPKRLDELAGAVSRPVVVDVHTGVDGRTPDILHAATGFAREAVLTVDKKAYRGARYRFFSFGDSQRWTDQRWRETLAARYPEAQRAWRLKLPTTLVAEVVLSQAGRDEKPQSVVVVLTETAAGAQLDAWVAAQKANKTYQTDVTAGLELPLSLVPALAQQPWVARIEPPSPPAEPLQPTPAATQPPAKVEPGNAPPATAKPE